MFVRKKELKNIVSKIYESIKFNRKEMQDYMEKNEQEYLLPVYKKIDSLEERIKQLEERK